MRIRVDFYKPSGKWAYGGEVEVNDVKLWHDNNALLKEIILNQEIMNCSLSDLISFTIVTDDLHENFLREDYKDFFKAILQVGKQ